MLILVSDLHLTDTLKGGAVGKDKLFERFWTRINAARGQRPAEICFIGDVFDIVRSPTWLQTQHRPYHDVSPPLVAVVDSIVDAILEREKDFITAIRKRVQTGELKMHYVLGNHDRLLAHAPQARQKIWKAFTGLQSPDVVFPQECIFPYHQVLAFHGHRTDFICHEPDGSAPIGDAIGTDLIVRFPTVLREQLEDDLPELDDIDDVRPLFAVPAWVRHFASTRPGILKPTAKTWQQVVEDFLETPFVHDWMRAKKGFVSEGAKLKLLLQLSTGRIMRKTSDHRLSQLYKFFQHSFDGRFARQAAQRLNEGSEGLRYVVNGHSHFASMTPLGQIHGEPACYFNTGTWRTVHQMGNLLDGRPTFVPYDAMSYLVFFPEEDALGRNYEWWTGAMTSAS